jgi:hypothetical protein
MRDSNRAKLDALMASDEAWLTHVIDNPKVSKTLKPADSLLAKFAEVSLFFERHQRAPDADSSNLKESGLGARLRGMQNTPDTVLKLKPHDVHGLLVTKTPCDAPLTTSARPAKPVKIDDLLDDPLFNDLSAINTSARANRPSLLSTTRSVSQRRPCEDFERFKLKFTTITNGLIKGSLVKAPLSKGSKAKVGDVFAWRGLLCFVEKEASLDDAEKDGRIRVVFSNGTESWMKPSSVTRHFYALKGRGETNAYVERIILASEAQPESLPDNYEDPNVSGYIYVVRTLSTHPNVLPHKKKMVKIGATKGNIKKRISSAESDPTFLLSRAKVVRAFTLKNLDPFKVEKYLHALFSHRQLEINIRDRFGKPVMATEWFAVSPAEVSEAVEALINKTASLT